MAEYIYLAHHGIKGQKWGVRRYQNPDGTLTDEGRKRYYDSDGALTKRGLKALSKKEKEYWDRSDDVRFDPMTLTFKLDKSGDAKEAERAERRRNLYDKLTKKADEISSLELESLAVKEQARLEKEGRRFSDDYMTAQDLQSTALYAHQFLLEDGRDFISRTLAGLSDSDLERYKKQP